MDEQDRVRQYLRLFGECFDVLSKWVKRALIVLVVMLILIQGALHIKQVRPYLSPVYKLTASLSKTGMSGIGKSKMEGRFCIGIGCVV